MFTFTFAKNKQLLARLNEYIKVTEDTLSLFSDAMTYLLENSMDDRFSVMAAQVSKHESIADDLRRQIELEMYQKSLLPETRKDLLIIIENIDRIPTRAETILNMFLTQKTVILDQIKAPMLELVTLSLQTYKYTVEAVEDCFGKMTHVNDLNRLVDNNESIGDGCERKMISTIFDADIDTADKILQKEFVLQLGSICDMCETTLDLVVICAVKRSV